MGRRKHKHNKMGKEKKEEKKSKESPVTPVVTQSALPGHAQRVQTVGTSHCPEKVSLPEQGGCVYKNDFDEGDDVDHGSKSLPLEGGACGGTAVVRVQVEDDDGTEHYKHEHKGKVSQSGDVSGVDFWSVIAKPSTEKKYTAKSFTSKSVPDESVENQVEIPGPRNNPKMIKDLDISSEYHPEKYTSECRGDSYGERSNMKTYDDNDDDAKKAKKWQTNDDVNDYSAGDNDDDAKKARDKAKNWQTNDDVDNYSDGDYDFVYDYRNDNDYKAACTKYVYFWKNKDIYSQWYSSEFVVNGKEFKCAEQFMMYKKAELFEDFYIAKQVLKAKNPKKMKALGRKVNNFSEDLWAANCLYIVKQANIAKFSQNYPLRKELYRTFPKILVEASPFDKIWGIGFAEDECEAWDQAKWQGKNLLGYIITEVRDELMYEAGRIKLEEKKMEERSRLTDTSVDPQTFSHETEHNHESVQGQEQYYWEESEWQDYRREEKLKSDKESYLDRNENQGHDYTRQEKPMSDKESFRDSNENQGHDYTRQEKPMSNQEGSLDSNENQGHHDDRKQKFSMSYPENVPTGNEDQGHDFREEEKTTSLPESFSGRIEERGHDDRQQENSKSRKENVPGGVDEDKSLELV